MTTSESVVAGHYEKCGPIFLSLDKRSETGVRQRVKNLSDYLASLQVGQKPRAHETL